MWYWYLPDWTFEWNYKIDGLVQERLNSIVNALELRLSCTNPSLQAGKQKIFGTRPNCVVSNIAYTKFHSPRLVFHSPGQIFTRIGERASASFPACILCLIMQWLIVEQSSNNNVDFISQVLWALWDVLVYHTAHNNGLVQERCNSSALEMELCLSCVNPAILF